jgi:hypothetical protein
MMLFALALMAAADTLPDPKVGKETVISFASGGGLRDWQAGAPDSGILYVRDRTQHWYQVTLSGPCVKNAVPDNMTYTTDINGTFDKFSMVQFGRYPNQTCGVTSIRTSTPPPGQPGANKK